MIRMCTPFEALKSSDLIIDVRSQSEYLADHIPNAISLPVLSDDERAEVGLIYVQQSKFLANRIGASYIAKNISEHLLTTLSNVPQSQSLSVYCWRGGQRSQSLAHILNRIGWNVNLVQGGYKAFRATVVKELPKLCEQLKFIVVRGLTGAGKTKFLRDKQKTAQAIDLEHLANHRGSLLGSCGEQPTQKSFETQIFNTLVKMDCSRPIWIEGESKKIGRLHLPREIWGSIEKAEVYWLEAPLEERVHNILKDYQHFTKHTDELLRQLQKLKLLRGKETIKRWENLIYSKQWEELVADLLKNHYDICYRNTWIKYHNKTP